MKHSDENSSGMTEEKLLELCNSKHSYKLELFWTAEIYGFGKYIRKYGWYPSCLPLAIFTDHGPGQLNDKPLRQELNSHAPAMLYHSPESVKIWKKFSKKPCYILYSPFVFYRRKNNVIQDEDAKGTVVFINHTTPHVDDTLDLQEYIDQLKGLPEKFRPISVCLHYCDVQAGRHKIFMKNNIPVYTAGNNHDYFIENFYDILKKFKYACSNQAVSSLLYAVEMGIPFFIFGDKSKNINKSDPNFPIGKCDDYEKNSYFQELEKMFLGLDCAITDEKRRFVERDLGIHDGISRKKMAVVLYMSLFKVIFSKAFMIDLARWVSRNAKELIGKKNK